MAIPAPQITTAVPQVSRIQRDLDALPARLQLDVGEKGMLGASRVLRAGLKSDTPRNKNPRLRDFRYPPLSLVAAVGRPSPEHRTKSGVVGQYVLGFQRPKSGIVHLLEFGHAIKRKRGGPVLGYVKGTRFFSRSVARNQPLAALAFNKGAQREIDRLSRILAGKWSRVPRRIRRKLLS